MAKWIIGGEITSYTDKLSALVASADEDLKRAIYPGAKVVMDAVKASAQGLPVQTSTAYDKKGLQTGLSTIQKSGIINGLGLATMRTDGGIINTKVGVDGYNNMKTKKYPTGQPNAMIVRSIESGTSFRAKNPFISRATKASRAAAEAAMAKQFDEDLRKKFP